MVFCFYKFTVVVVVMLFLFFLFLLILTLKRHLIAHSSRILFALLLVDKSSNKLPVYKLKPGSTTCCCFFSFRFSNARTAMTSPSRDLIESCCPLSTRRTISRKTNQRGSVSSLKHGHWNNKRGEMDRWTRADRENSLSFSLSLAHSPVDHLNRKK